MKTLDRYLVGYQLRVVAGVLALFVILIFLTHVIEDLDTMVRNKATVFQSIEFFLLNLPPSIPQLLPFAFLLGSIMTGHTLMRKGEVTGMLAGGVSPRRIFAGVLVISAFASFLLIVVWDRVSIPSAQRANEVIRTIKGQEEKVTERGMFAILPNNRLLHVQTYHGPERILLGLTLLEFGGGDTMKLQRRIESPRAVVIDEDAGLWRLSHVTERVFSSTEVVSATDSIRTATDPISGLTPIPHTTFHSFMDMALVATKSGDRSFKESDPKDMTLLQLNEYIRRIDAAGERTTHYRYEFHRRLAYPWNCLGLAVAGLVIAIRRGGRHIALEMAIGMLVASGFYTLQTFVDTLAVRGFLEPVVAVWTPPLLFAIVGMILLGRAGQR